MSSPFMTWAMGPIGLKTTHFWGPIANWGLAGSGIYDAACKGPEIINERMSATQVLYSGLFARFGWQVQPRNYILTSCHVANVCAQSNQLRRWGVHKTAEGQGEFVTKCAMGGAGAAVAVTAFTLSGGPIQKWMGAVKDSTLDHRTVRGGELRVKVSQSVRSAARGVAKHPAGPFYVHFWAPNFKWALSINNLLDYNRPTDKISLSMNGALTLTGCLFMRWSMVIKPKNYSLFAVNAALFVSSGWLLGRKVHADYM